MNGAGIREGEFSKLMVFVFDKRIRFRVLKFHIHFFVWHVDIIDIPNVTIEHVLVVIVAHLHNLVANRELP